MFRPNVRKSIRLFGGNEDGALTALSLALLVAFLMIFGLAVDYANGIRLKAQLQAATDASALAAVIDLPDNVEATSQGLAIARTYLADTDHGNAILASDFEYGQWDGGTFIKDATPHNAVRVTMNRGNSRGNALRTYMLRLVGMSSFDVAASSIALARVLPECETGGFFSEAQVISGSNNDYLDEFCLYGRQGVKIGSDNTFDTGANIGMESLSNFEQSGNNRGVNDALIESTYDLVLPDLVGSVIGSMASASLTSLPGFVSSATVRRLNSIDSTTVLIPNSLYIVDEVADLGSDRTISDIAIVAGKEIKVGSNNTLYNVAFATHDKILYGSNNEIGLSTYCGSGEYSSYAFTSSNIEFGSANLIRGMQMASRQEIKLGSDVRGIEGVHAEALGNFDYGSADVYGGCPGGLDSAFANPEYDNGIYVHFSLVR